MARSTGTSSAREQARKLQQQQQRKQKQSSMILPIVVTTVAVVLIGSLVWWVIARDGEPVNYAEGPAPAVANEYGGITLTSTSDIAEGEDLGTVSTEEIPELDDIGVSPRTEGEAPHVTIYTDPSCVYCQQLESEYEGLFQELLDDGLITLEYRSVGLIDTNTNYSSRAINAFSCMAEESPENYKGYLAHVTGTYAQAQPDNDTLIAVANNAFDADIADCVNDGTYRAYGNYMAQLNSYAWEASQGEGLGTPIIMVDDQVHGLTSFEGALLQEVGVYADEVGSDLDVDEVDDSDESADEDDSDDDAADEDAEENDDDAEDDS